MHPGAEHAGHLADRRAVVADPVVVDHVERGHGLEGLGPERQPQHRAAHGPHAALAAERDRLGRQVDPERRSEAGERHQVEAGPAAGVEQEQPPLARPRLEQRQRHRALAGVPPLALLRLEHPAVLDRLHRRVASEVK
jgi:hypothetical protein